MVVVVVIGILVAIVIPRLSGAEEAANRASCQSNLRLRRQVLPNITHNTTITRMNCQLSM